MNPQDHLRWLWAARLSGELADWADLTVGPSTELPGIAWSAPLPTALLTARIARMLGDCESPNAIEANLEDAVALDGCAPPANEWIALVRRALRTKPWPRSLPSEPRSAELIFTELLAAARASALQPAALHRELAQRWGVTDPRMLHYLSRRDAEPFGHYLDFREAITEQLEPGPAQNILVKTWYAAAEEVEGLPLSSGLPPLPDHLEDLVEQLRTCLATEQRAKGLRARVPQGHELTYAFEHCVRLLGSHRERLARVMEGLTVHECDLIQSALQETKSTDKRVAPVVPHQPVRAERLDDVSIAVRLRRLWLDELTPWLDELDNELADVWQDSALRRVGLTLEVLCPINFGEGDPLSEIREDLLGRLAHATDERVNRVRVEFIGRARYKVPSRAKSSELDIFHSGDPGADAIEQACLGVGERLRSNSDEAMEAITSLRLSSVSRHRVWLVAPDHEAANRIGQVPGAGHALWDAVRRWQGVSKGPLYTVHVDRQMWARSIALQHRA